MTFSRSALRLAAIAAAVALLPACGDETAPVEDHTPVTFAVLVDSVAAPVPLTLTGGVSVRIRLKFFNAASEDLDDVEGSHFGGLTFEPASLATVARVAGHNFQFDVTGGTPGTGTVQVSYGHDELADETSFPNPPAVTVNQAP